ncbi:flavin-binding monooxygenase-like-domain-containing protein [Entophlyctis helioformis]|nr:flavin-binding monooxygenase-like-domain-containing protein [Entophlyctis helioformis]
MSQRRPRVAVIGAGASGLSAIKECIAEGLDVVCFDQEPQVGGLWRYVPAREGEDPHSSVYESTVINTSKEMLAYSDFPVPKEWPTFMPHRYVARYLQMYAEHFDLKKHIKFNRRVLSIVPENNESGEHTGRWEVTTQKCRRKGPTRMMDTSAGRRGRSPPAPVPGAAGGSGSSIFLNLQEQQRQLKQQQHQQQNGSGEVVSDKQQIEQLEQDMEDLSLMYNGRKRSLSPVQIYDPSQGYEADPFADSTMLSENGSPLNANTPLLGSAASISSPKLKPASLPFDRDHERTSIDPRSPSQVKSKREVFDFVIVCTGHHWKPRLPDFEGIEHFQGTMLHSHLYRVPYPFKDQRVLVIGAGNSGTDIATEISHHASQVLLSTRTGTWVVPRTTLFGVPMDHISSRAMSAVPRPLVNFAVESLLHLHHGDLSRYGLKPNHHFTEAHPTINGELLGRIDAGRIVVRPNVSRVKPFNVIEFVDNSEERVDSVIYCTGYKIEHPFLDSKAILGQEDSNSNRVRLYKHIFPVNHRNIAFCGMVQSSGSVIPVAEMQARWVARVFAGRAERLPPPKVMRDTIDKDWVEHCKVFVPRERHTVQVDFVTYMDEIAKYAGCLPDLWRIWKTNWTLATQVTFGPALPFHYRIEGAGAWAGAEAAISDACAPYDLVRMASAATTQATNSIGRALSPARGPTPAQRQLQQSLQQSSFVQMHDVDAARK